MTPPTRNFAAIDLGTNSFHLIVVEASLRAGRFRILDREKENVRLGSGSTDMKHLKASAMDRGVAALRRFRSIADSHQAEIRAIATSAVREALNRDEFLRRVRVATGIRVGIASGAEEARLIHLGILQALPVFDKRLLVIDVGGGSSEFIFGRRRRILYSNSLKLGAVRLTQRFFRGGVLNRRSVEECRSYVRGFLAPVKREARNFGFEICAGSSGTILNLANMVRVRRGEPGDAPLNNIIFSVDELTEVADEILSVKGPEDRAELEGLDPARADIIPAGVIILEQSMRQLGISSITTSEFALREGIILDMIERYRPGKGVDHLRNIRYHSVLHLVDRFRSESAHPRHVARLALRLFDATQGLHHYGAPERELLEAAALLHEVGFALSHAQHHRHSYYLIRNAELLGFTENEKEVIANVARYHRKSHPKLKHEGYRLLGPEDRERVRKLSAILRIADGLDRNHQANVGAIRVLVGHKTLTLIPRGMGRKDLELEVWGAEQKKQLFEEEFGVTVHISRVKRR
jgi:exopolyphosphatase/guanosine-5'-triphosphate,3'-diphosphate pyrophosphatase